MIYYRAPLSERRKHRNSQGEAIFSWHGILKERSHVGISTEKHCVVMNKVLQNGLAANAEAYFLWLVLMIMSVNIDDTTASERVMDCIMD